MHARRREQGMACCCIEEQLGQNNCFFFFLNKSQDIPRMLAKQREDRFFFFLSVSIVTCMQLHFSLGWRERINRWKMKPCKIKRNIFYLYHLICEICESDARLGRMACLAGWWGQKEAVSAARYPAGWPLSLSSSLNLLKLSIGDLSTYSIRKIFLIISNHS